jgi:hypothetical protein
MLKIWLAVIFIIKISFIGDIFWVINAPDFMLRFLLIANAAFLG